MELEFGDLPELETQRLLLRKLTTDDASDVFEYASDSEVTKYLMWSPHKSIDDVLSFISASCNLYAKRRAAPWGMVLKSEQKIIGTCDFIHWRPEHARGEIGYALSRQYWGMGIMTEAVRAMVSFGFEAKGLNRIQAMCEIPNVGSARVMEKCGMAYEGTLRQYMIQSGCSRDMKMYAILRADWKG